MKWLKGKKTYIAAGLLAGQALLNLLTGDLTLIEFLRSPELTQLLTAAGAASLRDAIG